jgi:hypothetical protein
VITHVAQRWNAGRASYRPAGEPIDTRRYEVASIDDDTTAKRFVVAHHYSGSYPSAKFRFGLFHGAELVGVAVPATPTNPLSLACLPGTPDESVVLGRFVLADRVPANGESWFLARVFEKLRREGVVGIVSFSDPCARTDINGETVFGGHVGTIYQATNAVYLGRSKAETVRLFPDGTVLPRRAISKLCNLEVGHRYVEALVTERGGAREPGESSRAWVARVTRPLKHPGNLKYAWTLRRADRRHLPKSQPYEKVMIARAA